MNEHTYQKYRDASIAVCNNIPRGPRATANQRFIVNCFNYGLCLSELQVEPDKFHKYTESGKHGAALAPLCSLSCNPGGDIGGWPKLTYIIWIEDVVDGRML